jgi:rubrerythrin
MKKVFVFAIIGFFALAGCKQEKPVKTIENLKAGIKGETTASAKYAAFALKAKEEGLTAIAKLFEATSKSESIHASNHTKALEALGEKMEEFTPEFEVKSTVANLQAAMEGESYEVSTMYPKFLEEAKLEKAEKAEKSFTWAMDTERKHKEFYQKALDALKINSEKMLPVDYAVCPVCGNTYSKAVMDDKCAFCQTSKDKFITI